MTTEATTSTPDGTSVDQVSAVNALLAQELGFGTDEPPKEEEEGAGNGQPETLTPEEGEGEESVAAEPEGDETWGKALGIDDEYVHLDDNGHVAGLRVKVGDDETVVPVKELVASYQTAKYNTQKSQALSEERKQFEQVRDSAATAYLRNLEEAEQLTRALHEKLFSKFQGVNWEELRASNPAEYVAMKDEADAELQRIQAVFQAVQGARERQMSEAQQQYAQNLQTFVSRQMETVLANNPDWHDPVKRTEAIKSMGNFATEQYGFAPEEFAQIQDARMLEVLKDAMAHRKGQALVEQKTAGANKFMKAGKTNKPMDRLTQLTLNARKAKGANAIKAQALAVNELLSGL